MAFLSASLLISLAALAAAEAAVRVLRIDQFPLFAIGGPERYRMASNQSGRFNGRIRWHYDRFGMRYDGEFETLAGALILLGDSVVEGGTTTDQDNTIMASLGRLTDNNPYPVASPGWSLANQVEALCSLPGWDHARWLVCLVNAGDFDEFAKPESPLSFPTHKPILMLPWLLRRHLSRRPPRLWPRPNPSPEPQFDPAFRVGLVARFAEMAKRFQGSILLVYVPMWPEIKDETGFCRTLAGAAPGSRFFNVGETENWGKGCYADVLHPSAQGRAELARLIAGQIALAEQSRAN